MNYRFSFVIPVYNRREEVRELLDSMVKVNDISIAEILIIEDGSTIPCKDICESYSDRLHISYHFKPNSGPGDSRNYGMRKAQGLFFIILDSDVLLPEDYMSNLVEHLISEPVDCFGGPDAAHEGFSNIQKAINYTMTSFLTTGGLRGSKNTKKYEPRSFNMGLSRMAFEASKGFSDIHPGEDPDLSIRLKQLGFKTAFFQRCFVYHKRRIDFVKFVKQVYKFGLVRPILNLWHPESRRLTFYFPSCFSLGFVLAFVLSIKGIFVVLYVYLIYFLLILIESTFKNKNLLIGFYSVLTTIIQFFGYGYGFLKSSFNIFIRGKQPRQAYPFLFFKK